MALYAVEAQKHLLVKMTKATPKITTITTTTSQSSRMVMDTNINRNITITMKVQLKKEAKLELKSVMPLLMLSLARPNRLRRHHAAGVTAGIFRPPSRLLEKARLANRTLKPEVIEFDFIL